MQKLILYIVNMLEICTYICTDIHDGKNGLAL